jgi:hypothetical protein
MTTNSHSPSPLRDLRRFLVRAAALVLLLVAAHGAILAIPTEKGGYLSAVIDKQARLRSLPSPKLVLVGGSNLSFAVDSARLERELGLPVVNMGLGIYAGLRFMLASVEPHLGTGDVVVVSPEYQLFRGLYDGQEELLEVLDAFPEGVTTVGSLRQFAGLVKALPAFTRNKVNRLMTPLFASTTGACVYCRRAFNEYGDIVASLDGGRRDVVEMALFRSGAERGPVDAEAIAGLADFVRAVGARGARVVLVFPAVPEPHFAKHRTELEAIAERIRAEVPVPILGDPDEHTLPVELYYDWVYHLLPEGRVRRTEMILERLRTFLASSSVPAALPLSGEH